MTSLRYSVQYVLYLSCMHVSESWLACLFILCKKSLRKTIKFHCRMLIGLNFLYFVFDWLDSRKKFAASFLFSALYFSFWLTFRLDSSRCVGVKECGLTQWLELSLANFLSVYFSVGLVIITWDLLCQFATMLPNFVKVWLKFILDEIRQ